VPRAEDLVLCAPSLPVESASAISDVISLAQVRQGFSDFHDLLNVRSRKYIYLQRRIPKNQM
jgi:hypothetical protein